MIRALELDTVFVVNGRLAIRLQTFAKLLHYSDVYLLQLIKKLIKKDIYVGFKWKRNWYIFLPKKPITILKKYGTNEDETAVTPSGTTIDVDWTSAIGELPEAVNEALDDFAPNIITVDDRLVISVSTSLQTSDLLSSTLTPKKVHQFIPLNLGKFRSTKEYKYGYYIIYDENKMSTFDPGIAGTLNSTQIPQAFFEVCRALDAAENSRNGANPGLPARRNLSTTVSFDTGTIAVAATIPITTAIQADGTIKIVASDYLGSTYSAFVHGGGDLTSTNIVAAFLETASLLSASEKAVVPAENQPNNIQIQFDVEAGSATVSANMPFTTLAATNGDVTVQAIDYL